MLLLSLYHVSPQLTLSKLLALNIMYFEQKVPSMAWTSCWAMGATIIKLGELGSQRIGTSALSWLQHYLEQHPHDFSFLVDQMWNYNLWFTTKFLGQIWWKKELWVLFSNAKPKTCNLDIWYDMIYIYISYHMGTSCLGYELSWVRVVLGTSCPGYELSWVRAVLGTSCLGYELSWVRVVLGTNCFRYELSRSPCSMSYDIAVPACSPRDRIINVALWVQ